MRRNVALAVIVQNGEIQYATELDREKFRGLSIGTPLEVRAKPTRNLAHHRKYFALMKMGMEYWKPEISLVSNAEAWIAHKVAKQFEKLSGIENFYEDHGRAIVDSVILNVTAERGKRIDPSVFNNLDLYRRKIMIDAGFYEHIVLPDGGTLREPYSIAFDHMSQDKFNEIYRGCFNQIWQQTLIHIFSSQEEAQRAIDELMGFV